MRVTENKGITLLYISNGIHFKLSSLSAKSSATAGLFFAFKGGIRNLVLSLINITLVLRGLNGHHTVGRGW